MEINRDDQEMEKDPQPPPIPPYWTQPPQNQEVLRNQQRGDQPSPLMRFLYERTTSRYFFPTFIIFAVIQSRSKTGASAYNASIFT